LNYEYQTTELEKTTKIVGIINFNMYFLKERDRSGAKVRRREQCGYCMRAEFGETMGAEPGYREIC